MTYRTRYFDPDYRRNPKTPLWCECCQRDLKPGQPHRQIMYELDTMEAVHQDDWERAAVEIVARRGASRPRGLLWIVGWIGMDCARKLGLEWTRECE